MRKKDETMTRNNEAISDVLKNLCDFYDKNKNWISEYKKYADEFNTELVERNIQFNNLNAMLEKCNILVLTANKIEQNVFTYKLYNEVNANSTKKVKLREIHANNCVYQFASIRNINIVHMHPQNMASYTKEGSLKAVNRALERFRPKLVVSLGVAFGIDPVKQQLGDVLLSSAIIPYDAFNKDNKNTITLRSEDKYLTHEALNAWDVLIRSKNFLLEEQECGRQSLIGKKINFKWKHGVMLSGGSVLNNERKKRALLKAAKICGEDNIIGGEMEGSGVYYACQTPDIPCIVIKGICDWGAEKNSWETAIQIVDQKSQKNTSNSNENSITNDDIKDYVQAYATDNAAEALFRLLRFDSNFLDTYSFSKEHNKQGAFKKIKNLTPFKHFWVIYKNKLLHVIGICLFLIIAFTVFNYISNLSEYIYRLVYGLEILILLYSISIYIYITKPFKHLKCNPINIHNIWINFSFEELDLIENSAHIILNDYRPIFHVVVSYWRPSGKIIQDIQEIGNLKAQDSINLTELDLLRNETVLQIEYELSNGEHYAHLISVNQSRKKIIKYTDIVYCEQIFLIDGQKESFIGMQNALIKHVK